MLHPLKGVLQTRECAHQKDQCAIDSDDFMETYLKRPALRRPCDRKTLLEFPHRLWPPQEDPGDNHKDQHHHRRPLDNFTGITQQKKTMQGFDTGYEGLLLYPCSDNFSGVRVDKNSAFTGGKYLHGKTRIAYNLKMHRPFIRETRFFCDEQRGPSD